MNKFLKKSWQTMIINGIVAILLGVLFMFTQDDAINLIIKWRE
ncbi:MAG: hypothetical protein PHR20_03335 [Bacteroidales bacterium]|nr:hypothetical protein [Bacteroidales bacterium]